MCTAPLSSAEGRGGSCSLLRVPAETNSARACSTATHACRWCHAQWRSSGSKLPGRNGAAEKEEGEEEAAAAAPLTLLARSKTETCVFRSTPKASASAEARLASEQAASQARAGAAVPRGTAWWEARRPQGHREVTRMRGGGWLAAEEAAEEKEEEAFALPSAGNASLEEEGEEAEEAAFE